jgi:hypothetical protein
MSYSITALAETIGSPEEREGPAFQPEAILPEQFLAEVCSRATGERLLLIALLQDAINCFQKYLFATRARSRRLFREAEGWIMDTAQRPQDEGMHPYFSFEQTCCFLGLDPGYVRGELLRWRQRQLDKARQPVHESPGGPLPSQRPPTSNHNGHGRAAFASPGRMNVAQDHPGNFSDSVLARRAVQRIAS